MTVSRTLKGIRVFLYTARTLQKYYEDSLEKNNEFWLYFNKKREGVVQAFRNHVFQTIYRDNGDADREIIEYIDTVQIFINKHLNREEQLEWQTVALKSAERLGVTEDIAKQYQRLGGIHNTIGNYEEALEHLHKALDLYHSINDEKRLSTLCDIGSVYINMMNYDIAISYLEQAVSAISVDTSLWIQSQIHNTYGSLLHSLGKYEESLKRFEQSLKINKSIGREELVGIALDNIGVVLEGKGRAISTAERRRRMENNEPPPNNEDFYSLIQPCIDAYEEAINIHKKTKSNISLAKTLNNAGGLYLALKKYDIAISYFKEAERLSHEFNLFEVLLAVSIKIGAYYMTGDYNPIQAIKRFQKAEEIANNYQVVDAKVVCLEWLGIAFYQINQKKEAGDYLFTAYEIAQSYKSDADRLVNFIEEAQIKLDNNSPWDDTEFQQNLRKRLDEANLWLGRKLGRSI